jgi:aspartokinase
MLVVQKYGGSSLRSPRHIQRAARRIKELKETGADVVVVVSAMGYTTDHLLKLARRTVKTPPSREMDMLLTAGERVSMSLLAMSLHEENIPAISFTGSQSGIVTTNDHTEAKILEIRPHRIEEELKKGKVVIIAGFQGVSREKEITTLGRGGSDTTAVAIAAALKADRCEILTDVDGLFTADPRIVPSARVIENCGYNEALEFSQLGAKMHARSLEVAKRFQVNVTIGASETNTKPGTFLIQKEENILEHFKMDVPFSALLPGLEPLKIPLRFFNYHERQSAFLVEKDKAELVKAVLERLSIPIVEVARVSVVSAVGEGISSCTEIVPLFLRTLEETETECLLIAANSMSVSAAIPSTRKERVAEALHAKLLN